MARKLSPKMTSALKLTFQAEVGISRTDQSVARSGIIESWMVSTSTHAALIDRGALTPMRMVYGGERDGQGWPVEAFGPLVQITAAGCEAIGRSMDEIVAWAWKAAMFDRAQAGFTGDIMLKLPVEVGAVVGWTHQGQSLTGEVRSIFGDALSIWVPSSSTTGYEWTVMLDAIERVIELAPAARVEMPLARDLALIEHVERGHDAANIVHDFSELPQYPEGTPEYDAYVAELKPELAKFVKGEPPYEYGPIDRTAILSKPIDSLMNSGARDDALLQADLSTGRADRRALAIVPPAKPLTLIELIDQHGMALVDCREAFGGPDGPWREAAARRDALKAEINRRLSLVAGLIPAEVRQILDGHA